MKWSNDGEYVRLANNQHYFDSDYANGERLPVGLIQYSLDNKSEVVYKEAQYDKKSGTELFGIGELLLNKIPNHIGLAKFHMYKVNYQD